MNRTIKDATIRRSTTPITTSCERTSRTSWAPNFARRLKTLGGLTPYEHICKVWTLDPDRFTLNPIHQMPGLNNQPKADFASLDREQHALQLHSPIFRSKVLRKGGSHENID